MDKLSFIREKGCEASSKQNKSVTDIHPIVGLISKPRTEHFFRKPLFDMAGITVTMRTLSKRRTPTPIISGFKGLFCGFVTSKCRKPLSKDRIPVFGRFYKIIIQNLVCDKSASYCTIRVRF